MATKHTGILNKEIARASAEYAQDLSLSRAPGLGPKAHKLYKLYASAAHRELKIFEVHKANVSAYRTSLHKEVRGYRTDLVAAKAHKLVKETARLEKLIKADEKIIGDINMWTAGVRVFGTKGKGTGTGSGGDGSGGDGGSGDVGPGARAAGQRRRP